MRKKLLNAFQSSKAQTECELIAHSLNAKYSSDPRQAYPEVKLQGRDLVRVVGIVAPFTPMGAGTRGKFVLSSPRGEMGPGDARRVPLAAVRHGRARQTSESGPCGDCRRVLW